MNFKLISAVSVRENIEFRYAIRSEGGAELKARVEAIARAPVTGPHLALADGPTANLDSKTKGQIIDLLLALKRDKGSTFLFSTHDPPVMEQALRVVSIHDGIIPRHRSGGR